MFSSIGRYLRALGYFITGRVDDARRTLDSDPHVIRAKFEEQIADRTQKIQQYKQAVAALIAQHEKKLAKLRSLTEEVKKLEDLKVGAAAQAKHIVAKLQSEGKSMDVIKTNETYQKCLMAFNDFSATLQEKQNYLTELEGDIQEYNTRIADHKIQLQKLIRDLDKLKSESAETIAEVMTANEEKALNDMLSGISTNESDKSLAEMREMRQRVKAEARISKELSDSDTKNQEAAFLDFAQKSVSNSEFEALMGFAESKDTPQTAKDTRESSKLPE